MVDFLCFANLRTGKKNQTTIKSVANGTPCNHRKTMPVYTKEFIRKKSNPRRHAQLVKIFRGVCEFRRSTKKKMSVVWVHALHTWSAAVTLLRTIRRFVAISGGNV
jgi:hypothetical protein